MTLKELKNTVVNTKTQAEYDELMRIYEEAGWEWCVKAKPTQLSGWYIYKSETCVMAKDRCEHSRKNFYEREGYKIITLEEFKKEQNIMKYKVGDVLENQGKLLPYTKILAICGEVYMMSTHTDDLNSNDLRIIGSICTEYELEEYGYKLYAPEPEVETIEIDGKKYDKSEVSERLKELKEIEE